MPPFRMIDTGVRGGRENIAFDQALIDLHRAGHLPDTLRFLRFRPSALIGRHQILAEEVDIAACRAEGIELGRRITGGGALYLDEGQLGWELVFRRSSLPFGDLAAAARAICEAAAAGLSRLGIAAGFRPRNDIEVEGRKIGGTGGFYDGPTLFYQGTVLVDFDPARMLRALRVPAAKLAKRGLETAAGRITTLRALLGPATPEIAAVKAALAAGFAEALGIRPEPGLASAEEEAEAARLFAAEIGTDSFVGLGEPENRPPAEASASLMTGSGSLRVDFRLEGTGERRIREALITGDFFVTPPRAVLDLEAALRGVAVAEARAVAARFLAGAAIEGLAPGAVDAVIAGALEAAGRTGAGA